VRVAEIFDSVGFFLSLEDRTAHELTRTTHSIACCVRNVKLHVIHDHDGMVSVTDDDDDIAGGDPTHSLHHLARLSRLSPLNSQLLSPEPTSR
jgi:hypothetical protein